MSSEQLPERRPKKIDLDLLPREYKPRKPSKIRTWLVIATIVLACLMVPFIILKVNSDSQIGPLETKLSQLQAELSDLYAIKAEADALQKQIDAAFNELAGLEQDYQTFRQGLVLWSEIIDEIDDILPGIGVTLTSITQSGSGISLVGKCADLDAIYNYKLDLEKSEYFSSADVISVSCSAGEECAFTIGLQLSEAGSE